MWSKPCVGNPACHLGNCGTPVLRSEAILDESMGWVGCCYVTRPGNPIGIIPSGALENISGNLLGDGD